MASIRTRTDNGCLFFDFRFRGARCREQTTLPDTPANRKRMQQVLDKIEAEITLGTFDYRRYFPSSKNAAKFDTAPAVTAPQIAAPSPTPAVSNAPLFKDFVETWWLENELRWRAGTKDTMRGTVHGRLVPYFGTMRVSDISRPEILKFRAEMAQEKGRNGNATLSPKTINQTMTVLKAILAEAADRFSFKDPSTRIDRLKVPRKDIEPFAIDEVRRIIAGVRADYRQYLIVRFFTGMRTGEANGLKWSYVDFDRNQILVRETFTHGRKEYTKTDGSQREIEMSQTVREALLAQKKLTGDQEYVFCSRSGTPIDAKNFTNRVWLPLLRYLSIKKRRPYQMRHTCATLWLGAGENPEWIARQLGHTTTEMLFRVYSRYVPNLTRKDGSAFDRLLIATLGGQLGEAQVEDKNLPAANDPAPTEGVA